MLILQGDTVICLKPTQLKTLNGQLALLSEYKLQCDKTVTQCDSLITDYKVNQQNLKALILNKDLELQNNQTEIGNLKAINKKTKKKWVKNALYCSGGSAVIGLLVGILIAK